VVIDGLDVGLPIYCFADPQSLTDRTTQARLAARKWALTSWRGGFGGTTCYDELLPAGPLAQAMTEHKADAAVIVGGDWCCFDPALASRQLALHVDAPQAMKLVVTQAPPGLGAIVTSRDVLGEFAEHGAGFGGALWYNPKKPVIDPIGRDVCLPVPPGVRDTFERFIYDTPTGIAAVRALADAQGTSFDPAATLADFPDPFPDLPSPIRHLTLELTPKREAIGPVAAQHYVALDRPDMPADLAVRVVQQAAAMGDCTIMLGHLGEPTLHPDLRHIVEAAREAGAFAVGVETDLLMPSDEAEALQDLPLDVIAVRFNADTSETYEAVMGVDGFTRAAKNLQRLFERRARCFGAGRSSGPWIVPKLVKVRQNVRELESFFDRWVTIAGHAVIERFDQGNGLAPDLSPVPMDPPKPLPTPLDHRCAYVLSDGKVTRERGDWLGQSAVGEVSRDSLDEIWKRSGCLAEAL